MFISDSKMLQKFFLKALMKQKVILKFMWERDFLETIEI